MQKPLNMLKSLEYIVLLLRLCNNSDIQMCSNVMKTGFLTIISFTIIARTSKCANILAISPFGGKSHSNIFNVLLKELAARGHEVDVVSHFPLKTSVPRYNDISIRGTLPIYQNNLTMEFLVEHTVVKQFMLLMKVSTTTICEAVFKSPVVHDLKNSTKKYDLLITHQLGSNCMLGFAHWFSVPSVLVTTSINLPWTSELIGLPDNPSYIPNYFTPYLSKMSFIERCINTYTHLFTTIGFKIMSNNPCNVIAKKFFGPKLPDLEDLARNVSLVLVNSHFSINQVRPVVPNFIEIAGLHINGNITLPKRFEDWLENDGKEGIIYLSFGSMMLTETLDEEVLKAFFNSFKRFPYKVLWKASREKFPKHLEIPENIHFEPWVPQMGVLCHPNVKMFISHGGMLSTTEALHCGVPILGIPLFGDQMMNIKHSVSKGTAIEIPYNNITEEKLTTAIKLLMQNPQYKTNCERVSRFFKDRPMTPLDTAIYWIEYVIRHNGAPHLRSVAADLPWYQYFLLDVAIAFLALILTIGFVLFALFRYLLFKCLLLTGRKKVKDQ